MSVYRNMISNFVPQGGQNVRVELHKIYNAVKIMCRMFFLRILLTVKG